MRTRFLAATAAIVALVAGGMALTAPTAATALTPGINFSADDLPTWQTNGVVRGMAAASGKVVVVGEFTQLRPGAGQSGATQTRNGLAILDADTGQPSSCQFSTALSGGTARLYAAATSPDGNTVFVGGNFSNIGGVSRTRLAELNLQTCTVTSFSVSSISSFVYSIDVTSDAVYFGGLFKSVAGQPRLGYAKVNRAGALDQSFVADAVGDMLVRPEPGVECRTVPDGTTQGRAIQVSPDGSKVVLGGSFYTLNGTNSHSIAVVDSTSGAVVRAYPADPNNWGSSSNVIHPCSFTKAIVSDANAFYIGNEGSGGGVFDGAAKFSWSTLDQAWRDTCLGAVQALVVDNDKLYQAHHHHDCASMGMYADGKRIYLSATDVNDTTQKQLGWNPTLNDGTGEGIGGRAMTVASAGSAKYLWVGGEFTRVNGVLQQGLTRFSTVDTGNPPTPVINVRAVTGGSLQIAARSVVDPDDGPLQYILYRNNVQLGQPITATSSWFERPQVTFVDSTATPGVSYSYRVRAVDAAGNQSALSAAQSGTASATGSAYAAAVIGDSPSLYWRYDDSGSWVIDRSGQTGAGKNGLARNGVTYGGSAIPGDSSSSATFDGVSQQIWNDQLALGPSTYSIETWFNTTSTTGGVLVNYGNGTPRSDTNVDRLSSNYDRMVYMEGSGRVRFGVYSGGVRSIRSDLAYNDGQWHHLVATQGPTGMRLYVDGKELGSTNVTTAQSYYGSWRVGGDNLNGWPENGGNSAAAQFFDGQLDETAIYPVALTQVQAITHFKAGGGTVVVNDAPVDAYGAAVFGDGPTSYWRFDEASGTVAEDSSFLGTRDGVIGTSVERRTADLLIAGGAVHTPGSNANGSGLVASALVSAPSSYSLEFWIKTATTTGGKIIGFENSATVSGNSYDKQVYMLNDGRLRFGVYTGSVQTVTSPLGYNNNAWHHVVATQDSTGMKLYVDGALTAQNGVTTAETGDGYWRVGGGNLGSWPDRPSSDYFAGDVDEVAIYPTAISATAVQQHHAIALNDTTPPSVPSAVTQNGTTAAQLSWTASTDVNGVSGYRVYRGTTADFVPAPGNLVGSVTTTSWNDADATPGVRYYRVTALDSTGNESAASAALQVTLADVTAPSTVTGLSASAAGVDVQLTWNAATDDVAVDRYLIYRGTVADFSIEDAVVYAQTATAGYLDSGVAEGQWYYRVVAVDAAGNRGAASAAAGALVDIDTDAPSEPADVATSVAATGVVTVSWSAATDDIGVAGYRVYRGTTAGFTADAGSLVADGVTATTWDDTTTTVGTRYYRVAAYDLAGNVSTIGASVPATVTDTTAPSAPTGVQASLSGTDVTVTWDASTDNIGVAQYRVFRGTTAGFSVAGETPIGQTSTRSFTDTGVAAGTWYYKVVAVDGADNVSTASAAASATVPAPDTTAPSVPAGVAANVSGTTVSVAWTASTDATGVTGYTVYRGTTSGFAADASSKLADVTATSYTDAGRPAGVWYYKVTAKDAAGNVSAASAAATATVAGSGQTQTVTVNVSADSMTAQSVPTTLYGSTNQLSSRGTNGTLQSFLRFVLPAAPAGTVLTGAELRVRTSTDSTAASTDTHSINLVTGAWEEATINWNNRPTAAGALLGALGAAPALNTAYTATLTPSALQGVLGSTQTFRLSSTGADNVRLWSKESTNATYRPVLVLTFTEGSAPEADTTAPSVPTEVAAAATGGNVAVSWSASTDAVGVTGYTVYRGTTAGFTADASSKIADVTGTSYADNGRPAGEWFYKVTARDAAGNVSAASTAASATVTAAATPVTVSVNVSADSMTAQSVPTTLYGSTNQLSSRGTNGTIESFLRFELPAAPAGTVLTGAELRYRTSTDATAASADTHSINLVTGAWEEATINWNNRPTAVGALLGTIGAAPALNTAYTAALTPSALTGVLGSTQTFRLSSTGADNIRIISKEGASGSRPVLVLTFTPVG